MRDHPNITLPDRSNIHRDRDARIQHRSQIKREREQARLNFLEAQQRRRDAEAGSPLWQPFYRAHKQLTPHYRSLLFLGLITLLLLPILPLVVLMLLFHPVRDWIWRRLEKAPELLATVILIMVVLRMLKDRLIGRASELDAGSDSVQATWAWEPSPQPLPGALADSGVSTAIAARLSPYGRYQANRLVSDATQDDTVPQRAAVRSLSTTETWVLRLATHPQLRGRDNGNEHLADGH